MSPHNGQRAARTRSPCGHRCARAETSIQFTGETVLSESKCSGKAVTIRSAGSDAYRRTLGEVILGDGRSLNRELVAQGFAWHYKRLDRARTGHASTAGARFAPGLMVGSESDAALTVSEAKGRRGERQSVDRLDLPRRRGKRFAVPGERCICTMNSHSSIVRARGCRGPYSAAGT